MPSLELKVPPPIVMLVCAGLMWLSSGLAFDIQVSPPWLTPLALALVTAGAFIASAGLIAFRQSKTTINPLTPDAATCIVQHGIYKFTRNPMYLGFAFGLLGWAVWLVSLVSLLWVAAFIVYMNRFQIIPEERMLAKKFGEPYTHYMQVARRWL